MKLNINFIIIIIIRKDQNEWSLPRSLGDIKIFIKNLSCSLRSPANLSSDLVVNLPKDLNQWRLRDRLPDERKYVIYNHNLNALIKTPFGVVTAFLNDPNPLFSSQCHSQESISSSCNTSLCSEVKLKSYTIELPPLQYKQTQSLPISNQIPN